MNAYFQAARRTEGNNILRGGIIAISKPEIINGDVFHFQEFGYFDHWR